MIGLDLELHVSSQIVAPTLTGPQPLYFLATSIQCQSAFFKHLILSGLQKDFLYSKLIYFIQSELDDSIMLTCIGKKKTTMKMYSFTYIQIEMTKFD